MKRILVISFALVVLITAHGGVASGEEPSVGLASEIFRLKTDWPEVRVEIPSKLYLSYLRETILGEKPLPKPEAPLSVPVKQLSTFLHYTLSIDTDRAELEVRYTTELLQAKGLPPIRLLPASLAWKQIRVNTKPVQLRPHKGWLLFEPTDPGHYEVVATAVVPFSRNGLSSQIQVPRSVATVSTVSVASKLPLDVAVSYAQVGLRGDAEHGTHGTVGITAGKVLAVTWRPVRSTRDRVPSYATQITAGFDIGEKTIDLQATLAVTLTGGSTDSIPLTFPNGADRISVTGSDVEGYGAGVVRLHGTISGETVLHLSCTLLRHSTARVALVGPNIPGASQVGGELVVATDATVELIEASTASAQIVDLVELSDQARGMVLRPPVMAYRLERGHWKAVVETISVVDLETAETLVDDAAYTLIIRPSGSMMVQATLTVRNTRRQFLRFRMPEGAHLISVRSAERTVSPVRGPDGMLLVPMEKSIEAVAGMISFPLEIAYLIRGDAFSEEGGRYSLLLPRPDAPVAYARIAVYVPNEVEPTNAEPFKGLFKKVRRFSLEEAEAEFTYGRGYVERESIAVSGFNEFATTPTTRKAVRLPGLSEEPRLEESVTLAPLPAAAPSFSLRGRGARRSYGQRGYFRAGQKAYARGDYDKAEEHFKKAAEINPMSALGASSKSLLDNTLIAQGKADGKSKLNRAKGKKVQAQLRAKNAPIRMAQLKRIDEAQIAQSEGNKDMAARHWAEAERLGHRLLKSGETKASQREIMGRAHEVLSQYKETVDTNTTLRKELAKAAHESLQITDSLNDAIHLKEALEKANKKSAFSTEFEIAPGSTGVPPPGLQMELRDIEETELRAQKYLRFARRGHKLSRSVEPLTSDDNDGRIARSRFPNFSLESFDMAVENKQLATALTKLRDEAEKNEKQLARLQPDVLAKRLQQLGYLSGEQAMKEKELQQGEEGEPGEDDELAKHQSAVPGGVLFDVRRTDGTGRDLFEKPSRIADQSDVDILNEWAYQHRDNWSLWSLGPDVTLPKNAFTFDRASNKLAFNGRANKEVHKMMEAFLENDGLKLRISSYNSAGSVDEVVQAGAQWEAGSDNLFYALLDDGQVEILLERDAFGGGSRSGFANKTLRQETLLGSTAFISNDTVIDLVAADDKSNTIAVKGQSVVLPYDKTLAVANPDGTFTLIRGGRLHRWGVQIAEDDAFAVAAPKAEVPEVGRLLKLEKIFPRDEDNFHVQFKYSWIGE